MLRLQTLATTQQLIHANADLPIDLRQNMVKLDFVRPVPRVFVHEFLRIRFSDAMKLGGEEVKTSSNRICPKCNGPWVTRGDHMITCQNPRCEWKGQAQNTKLPRGVVQILLPSDFIVNVDGQERCSSVILVLDRRYRDDVLAAVYRTAGEISERWGWALR